MTEGVHYIRDKASPLGHESEHANTRFEVEFVGHVLKSDGVCFSTEMRSKVLYFVLPVKQKQLKTFLGMVNYFRDHVQGLSHKVKPLNEIMIPYKKSTSIDWTPRLEQCFRDVQESMGNCPKLFYVDLSLPIRVRTHRDCDLHRS
jgi:hypothetical protein